MALEDAPVLQQWPSVEAHECFLPELPSPAPGPDRLSPAPAPVFRPGQPILAVFGREWRAADISPREAWLASACSQRRFLRGLAKGVTHDLELAFCCRVQLRDQHPCL